MEARIPIESGLEPLCTFDPTKLVQPLDELDEKREWATIRMTEYQLRASRLERLVRPRAFNKGKLVLLRTFKEGKLKLNWEEPYIIADDGCRGAYKIQSLWGGGKASTLELPLFEKLFLAVFYVGCAVI